MSDLKDFPTFPESNSHYASVEGKAIHEVIWGRLMPSLEGVRLDEAILSMLTFTVLLMKPDVELEVLKAAVQSASETMVLAITPVPEGKGN